MELSLEQMTALRHITSVVEAQRFLASREVPVSSWDRYLKLVGTATKSLESVSYQLRDPMRHWHWALLFLNGMSFRAIATKFGVQPSSVFDAVSKLLTEHDKANRMTKCSMSMQDKMLVALHQQRNEFLDKSDPHASAARLYQLALSMED